jgi:beta-aspartyl-peptidase (threonine type)
MIALLVGLWLAAPADFPAITKVLDAQVAAWNRGDLRGYMAGYANDPSTTFVSGDTVTRGWQTVYDRYAKKYDSREKMGTLAFSDIEMKPLGADDVLVTGAWSLKRAADAPHGRFTLLVRRIGGRWRIVYDHSS